MSQDLINEHRPPTPGEGDIWLLVLKDMEDRRQLGISKYGVPVQPFNGRDPLIDAYQEALDLCVYLRQAIEETNRMRVGLTRIRQVVENGDEWVKLSASSLHLMITDALGETKK